MGSFCTTQRMDKVAPAPKSGAVSFEPDNQFPDTGVKCGTSGLQHSPTQPRQPETSTPTKKKRRNTPGAEPKLHLPPALATVGKGVSLRGLCKVRTAIRKHFGDERYGSVSTTEVCHQWVKVVTAPAGKCRLVELPGLLDPVEGDVGRPMYFISHAWSNSIELLFRKVFDFLASADDGTRVWLDVLAVCQHESNPAHKADIAAFADVVAACSGGTLVVMDLTRCNPATRAWCVFEWAHTLAAHGPDGLHMSLAPLERAMVFADLDVERAECFRPADKEMIMREVRQKHGSPEAFNSKLKLQLLLEPLSYSVDLRRLQERSRDTSWEFSRVQRWLEDMCRPGASCSRAMCVVSGAGEGKSTISAELVRRLSPAVGGGGTDGFAQGGQITCAYHFLKYNDQRRLDPVRVIKTMSFQLASRIPSVCSALLDYDVAEVAQLTDVDRAFELLLLRPLQGVKNQVVIVLDALDEAEPVPLASAAAAGADGGGPAPPFSTAAAAAASPRPRSILAGGVARYPVMCGNRALQLLTKHLQRLPPEVRFFVTTRPDAASGQVVPSLERTFHNQGGSTYLRPSQLVRTQAPRAKADGPAVSRGGGGVMVYHTVVKACLAEEKDEEEGQAATEATPTAASPDGGRSSRAPLLTSLLGSMARAAVVVSSAGGGGGAAADLTALYHVYGKVFHKAYDGYSPRKRTDVSKLLNVLLAAQEPLSQSLVQQLGLGHAVPLLPGFPVLFYVDEHHLFTLHKSLADWLLLEATGGPGSGASGNQLEAHASSNSTVSSAAASSTSAAATGGVSNRSLFNRRHGYTATRNTTGGFFQLSRASPGQASRAAQESNAAAAAAQQAVVAAAANAPSPSFSMDLAQGHLLLGRYLSTTRNASPSTYCLKYLVTHLTAAGPSAMELLDDVLSSFGFIEAVFARGFSANMIRALGTMGHSSRLSRDALRWLRAKQHDLLLAASGGASGAGAAVGTALMSPIGSELYRVALRIANQGWRTRVVVPAYNEWPADQAVLKGHAGSVTAVLFSLDGRQLVSSSGGGHELRVWDISSGTCTAVLLGHESDVTCLAMSADGHAIASGSNDMTCRVWDAATGQCTAILRGHTAAITGVAFSPPERGKPPRLATASFDNTVRMWIPAPTSTPPATQPRTRKNSTGGAGPSHLNRASGRNPHRQSSTAPQLELELDVAMGLAARTSGGDQHAASSYEDGIGGSSYTCVQVLQGGEGGVQGVSWAPDGKRLAVAHGAEVCVWTLPSGKLAATLTGHEANVLAVAFSPNDAGRWLASCGWDKGIRLWDTRTNKCVATAAGHMELVRCLSWSPDGRCLASASSDNTLRIWDVSPMLEVGPVAKAPPVIPVHCTALLQQGEWMTAVSFSPDGRSLASGSVAKELRLWDVIACEAEFAAACAAPTAAAVAPTNPGATLKDAAATSGTAGGSLGTLDRMTQKSFRIFNAAKAEAVEAAAATVSTVTHTGDVTCIALSPDGALLATASQDKTVRLYDRATARWLLTLSGHDGCVTCVAWAPLPPSSLPAPPPRATMLHLASVSHDLTARIWALDLGDGSQPAQATCSRILSGHTDRVCSVAWSPAANGQLATGAEDNHVRLWDARSGTCLATLWGHGNYVTCVSYCPTDGGRTLASASQDATIRVWDTATSTTLRILRGHDHYVNHVAYSPCGSLLASAACDQTLRLWEHSSGKCIAVLTGHTHFVNCVAFEPLPSLQPRKSGGGGALSRRLVSASTDATVRVWNLGAKRCTAVLQGHSGPVHCVTWLRGATVTATRGGGGKDGKGGGGTKGGAGGAVQSAAAPAELASGAADHSVRLWCEDIGSEG